MVATLLIVTTTYTQVQEKDSVRVCINRLFTAMKNSDTALLKTCFADSAILQTIQTKKDNKTVIKTESVADFAKQMSGIPKDSCDERIEYKSILIDKCMATVWTPYTFYFNNKFSHCGVNSFVLVKQNGSWKIQYINDTRRKIGCVDNKQKKPQVKPTALKYR